MSDDVKAEVIKNTQDSLGKFIKKPALTDKLLKKPPFRFLHDVVTSTIRETGFLSGLYTETEMHSDNIKDREMKITFLQKLIDCVKLVTDKNITARPSKIVAGLEPTKTNELLQAIGFALKKKLDSSEVVAQLNQGNGEPIKTKTKTKDDKKTTKTKEGKEKTDKLKQSPSTNSITPRGRKSDTKLNKKEEKPKIKESPRTKTTTKKPDTAIKEVKKSKLSPKEKNDKQKEIEPEIVETPQEPPIPEPEPETIEMIIPEAPPEILDKPEPLSQDNLKLPNDPEENPPEEVRIKTPKRSKSRREQPLAPGPLEMPPEMLSKEPSKIEISRPKTSLRPPSVRPSSARPGAPRLKDRNDVILPQDEMIPMGKVNVIVENFSTQEEEDNEETVVVEAIPEIVFQEAPMKPETVDIPAEKGHLVAQILEQINDSSLEGHEPKKPVEIEWEGGGKRNREAASKEMEKLRDSIQTLTRAANPLGKLMNFLQEDIDSMRSELRMWIEVNEKLMGEIRTQEKLNDESIEPLKKQLNRLNDDILKQNEQISVTQANILKNEQKIKMLLTRDP